MENRVGRLIERHSDGNISEFSRVSGVPYGTLYDIVRGKSDIENVRISYFMKIAHTLGMTAEELYYGTPPEPPKFSDPQQNALNGYYESMNDTGRKLAVDSIRAMSSSVELRMVKEREVADDQTALEA